MHSEAFVVRLEKEPFYSPTDLNKLTDRLFKITSRDKLEAGNLERRVTQECGDSTLFRKVKWEPFCIACIFFIVLLVLPIMEPGM